MVDEVVGLDNTGSNDPKKASFIAKQTKGVKPFDLSPINPHWKTSKPEDNKMSATRLSKNAAIAMTDEEDLY